MRLSTLTALLVACAAQAQAAAVFAHFMVGNANNYTLANWEYDMTQAKNAHIDAFALNIANHDTSIYSSLALAFQAASAVGFQLFFSFDFAGGGAWDYNSVHTICSAYFGNSHYYHYNGLPFVSTFEGPDQSKLWADIKAALPCFFVPDWSSLGAEKAVQLGVFDGLFSWAAWPWGDRSMDTYGDGSYKQFLGGKPYMMPVAPWFFTNLPGYSKNWLWRGDDLWYDRWVQAIHWQPEFIEIISWNDYGESHYIGPLYDNAMAAFTIGKAPYNYAAGMPHDGWRQFLPFLIDTYKNGIATITQEGLTAWYRTSPGTACGSGGTSGNTATQLQLEMSPATIMEDKIFYSALLGSAATVTVTVGGVNLGAGWTSTPIGGAGMYHGSVSFAGHTGAVVITLSRGGMQISNGPAISTSCTKGITNWNAWVGSSSGGSVTATPTLKVSQEVCMKGTGNNNFKGLCEYACGYGYCPWQACVCTSFGTQVPTPSATWPVGYPLANEDTTYNGLCSFCCNHGYCPPTACSTNFVSVPVATWDDFANPACVGGTGPDNVVGLCQYGCPRGYCPMNACTCTATGTLAAQEPADTTVAGVALSGEDPALYNGLCNYACQRGYCPPQACDLVTVPDGTVGVGIGTSGQNYNPATTCQEVAATDSEQEAFIWNMVDATQSMIDFKNNMWSTINPSRNQFCSDFADVWDTGQSTGSCTILAGCDNPNCKALPNDGNALGTEASYAVILSCINFGRFLQSLYKLLAIAYQITVADLSSLQSTFYPASADSASDMQLTMIMHGIGAALGIMLAVIPEPWAPALSAAMTGAIDIFTDSLQDDSNIAEQILSNTIVVAGDTSSVYLAQQDALGGVFDALFRDDYLQGTTLEDVFANGAFLDYSQIILLNSSGSITPIIEFYTQMIQAPVMNRLWIEQGVFIMCFPMTQDEFNNLEVSAGSNDSRLKYYSTAHLKGCYFQSATNIDSGQGQPGRYVTINPPGWGSLHTGAWPWGTQDVFASSVDAYFSDPAGVYAYNMSADVALSIVKNAKWNINTAVFDEWYMPGLFNIPVCDLTMWPTDLELADNARSLGISELDYFNRYILTAPWPTETTPMGYYSSYCWCYYAVDWYGQLFRSQLGLDQQPCDPNNIPGGPPNVGEPTGPSKKRRASNFHA